MLGSVTFQNTCSNVKASRHSWYDTRAGLAVCPTVQRTNHHGAARDKKGAAGPKHVLSCTHLLSALLHVCTS